MFIFLPWGRCWEKSQCRGYSNSMIIFSLFWAHLCWGGWHASSNLASVMASHMESGNELWGQSQWKASAQHEVEARDWNTSVQELRQQDCEFMANPDDLMRFCLNKKQKQRQSPKEEWGKREERVGEGEEERGAHARARAHRHTQTWAREGGREEGKDGEGRERGISQGHSFWWLERHI